MKTLPFVISKMIEIVAPLVNTWINSQLFPCKHSMLFKVFFICWLWFQISNEADKEYGNISDMMTGVCWLAGNYGNIWHDDGSLLIGRELWQHLWHDDGGLLIGRELWRHFWHDDDERSLLIGRELWQHLWHDDGSLLIGRELLVVLWNWCMKKSVTT